MALRSGREYLEGLRDRRSVWLDGERVADVGQHPALRGCAETLAAQFDAQAAEAQRALLTTTSPSGAPVSAAWLVPRSLDELRQRRALVEHLARQHGGTMGRPPDYVPLILLGLYAGRGLMARTQPRWAQNIERFFCE